MRKKKTTKKRGIRLLTKHYCMILVSTLLLSMAASMIAGSLIVSKKSDNPVENLMLNIKDGIEKNGKLDDLGDDIYNGEDFDFTYDIFQPLFPESDAASETEDSDVNTDEVTESSATDTSDEITYEETEEPQDTAGETEETTETVTGTEPSATTEAEIEPPETTAPETEPPVTTAEPETKPPVTTAPETEPTVTTTAAPETKPPVTTAPETEPPVTTTAPETTPPETKPVIVDPPVVNEERVNDPDYFKDALFIGDSRTVGLAAYGKIEGATYFARTSANVANIFDIKAETENSGLNLTDFLKKYTFGKIYILLGINEIGYPYNWIVSHYRDDIIKIHELQPNAIIIIQANMHVTKTKSDNNPDTFNNTRINELNRMLSMLADNKIVFFLDVSSVFDDASGGMNPSYTGDGVHLYGKFYPLWRDFIIQHGKR